MAVEHLFFAKTCQTTKRYVQLRHVQRNKPLAMEMELVLHVYPQMVWSYLIFITDILCTLPV